MISAIGVVAFVGFIFAHSAYRGQQAPTSNVALKWFCLGICALVLLLETLGRA